MSATQDQTRVLITPTELFTAIVATAGQTGVTEQTRLALCLGYANLGLAVEAGLGEVSEALLGHCARLEVQL